LLADAHRLRPDPAHTEDAQYLRVFIRNLRGKLEPDPGRPLLIRTEPGMGYRLRDGA
jgi:two-component system KDP operon response regulator KdpE